MVELGTGMLVDEVEAGLRGMRSGKTKEITFAGAGDDSATVTMTVKEIKERLLPPLDDDLARTASEFETLADLRDDVDTRLRAQLEEEVESQFRQMTADALVAASDVEPAPALVESRTRELLQALARSIERRGLTLETYLRLTGSSGEELVQRLRAEAEQAVARELVLEAAADKLAIQVTDEEVEALLREQAEAEGDDPEDVLSRFRGTSAAEQLREDLRLRAALDRVVADVTPIPVELARARDSIWTPEQEKPETPAKLWTPSSKEPA